MLKNKAAVTTLLGKYLRDACSVERLETPETLKVELWFPRFTRFTLVEVVAKLAKLAKLWNLLNWLNFQKQPKQQLIKKSK